MEESTTKLPKKKNQINEQNKKILILGGGIAGLSVAWRLVEEGYTIEIFEREAEVGGLSRTINYKNFLFDYSAHRFNSDNPDILKRFKQLIGKNLLVVHKKSLIYHWGKYIEYPPKVWEIVQTMPSKLLILSCIEFVITRVYRLFKAPKTNSFSDWTRFRFGKTLSLHLNEKYAKKLWKKSPHLLSGDWAYQRIGSFKIIDFVIAIFANKSYNKVFKASDPDSDVFYYPSRGIGLFPKKISEKILNKGGTIRTQAIVNKIDTIKSGYQVSYLTPDGSRKSTGTHIVSTIPLDLLVKSFNPKMSKQVIHASKSLDYLAVIIVNILINRAKVTNVSWIYYPSEKILFNYIMEFKNWSKKMAPKNQTALNINITCRIGDEIWKMTDAEITERVIQDLENVKIITNDEVFDSFVHRLPYAYPVYDLNYQKNTQLIRSYIDTFPNFFLSGRTGNFRYINSDQAMEEGIRCA
ncbi:hypothetical protein COU87_05330, partial [Candidatus Roizmanbacteria bacterium CG10_big_fil_rev_8_21_14_0_10_39_12]